MIAWPISWYGMLKSGLHPALALAFIVPFMPCSLDPTGFFSSKSADIRSEKSDGGSDAGSMSDIASEAGSIVETELGSTGTVVGPHGHDAAFELRQKIPLFNFEHSVK